MPAKLRIPGAGEQGCQVSNLKLPVNGGIEPVNKIII